MRSAVMLVPAVGLIAFLVWGDPPPPNGPTDRQNIRNSYVP